MRRRLLGWLLLGASVLGGLLLSQPAGAARAPYNDSEAYAWQQYRRHNNTCGQGALWFNDKNGNYGASGWESGYYSTGVSRVEATQNQVTIYLHGSAVMEGGCEGRDFWATRISSRTSRAVIHGTDLYRGRGGSDGWTSIGGSLAATLDVSGIATPGDPNGEVVNVTFSRCGGWGPGQSIGRCREETLPVRVIRRDYTWRLNGQSYIKHNTTDDGARRQGENAVSAKPGDRLYWDHEVRNTRPNAMDRTITLNVDRVSKELFGNQQLDFRSNPAGLQWRGGPQGVFRQHNISQTVSQNDVGKRLCQRIAWQPGSPSNSGWQSSDFACASVPHSYEVTPTVNLTNDSMLEEGVSRVNGISGSVINGGLTRSKQLTHVMARFITNKGLGITASGEVDTTESDWVKAVAKHIGQTRGVAVDKVKELVAKKTEVIGHNSRAEVLADGNDELTDVGSLNSSQGICYVTIVNNYKNDKGGTSFRYAVKCLPVGKKPKVQVWGSDVRTNGQVVTSQTVERSAGGNAAAARAYGSWAEYGIFANRKVLSASGAGLSSPAGGRSGVTSDSLNQLTFANTGVPGFGFFSAADLSSHINLPRLDEAGQLTGGSLSGRGSGAYTAGNITIGSSTITSNLVIQSTGTVVIAG